MSDCQGLGDCDDARMQRIYEYLDGALTRDDIAEIKHHLDELPGVHASSMTSSASSATWSSAPARKPRRKTSRTPSWTGSTRSGRWTPDAGQWAARPPPTVNE